MSERGRDKEESERTEEGGRGMPLSDCLQRVNNF